MAWEVLKYINIYFIKRHNILADLCVFNGWASGEQITKLIIAYQEYSYSTINTTMVNYN